MRFRCGDEFGAWHPSNPLTLNPQPRDFFEEGVSKEVVFSACDRIAVADKSVEVSEKDVPKSFGVENCTEICLDKH